MTRLRLGILISGRGSNMQRLLDAASDTDFPAKPVLVLSNHANAAGLESAKAFGVDSVAVPHADFETREAFEREIDKVMQAHGVEIIALAGFMRVLTPWFVRRWQSRMINIHPSLLPKYPGLKTHARAIEAGDAEAGCSVHWVTEGVDEGGVIEQARVPVKAGDTPETLADRVLLAEHELYPRALAKACRIISERPTR